MKRARIETILGMLLATSTFGARGFYCGPCGGSTVTVIPVLPPSADGGPVEDAGDFLTRACAEYCAGGASCVPTSIVDGKEVIPAIECTMVIDCGGAGRRPEGLRPQTPALPDDASLTGAWLARTAFLEAASIDAFRLLRRQLAALGAPRRLLRAASRAARDEQRHARRMRSLARRASHGSARVPDPVVAPSPMPGLEQLATHNAVEGCVRETFGALVAGFQARTARDGVVRAAMKRIAGEEARHAALSWQIDAWARARLDRAARARVDRARAEAMREIHVAASRPVPEALVRDVGLPDSAQMAELAARLDAALGISAA